MYKTVATKLGAFCIVVRRTIPTKNTSLELSSGVKSSPLTIEYRSPYRTGLQCTFRFIGSFAVQVNIWQ